MSNLRVNPKDLSLLQYDSNKIRNICIVAHIDHGKTTLADSLVCSNGIISPKMAGKLRFLDSTEDEQKRGITMHSSAISLLYQMESMKTILSHLDTDKDKDKESQEQNIPQPEEYLINLVDSPGHIDFSSDVSTATRLCDGALIVVDVLEGVCSQTHALLYKALRDRLNPCLVLNKIDRLITELKLTPLEAFQHIRRVLERVNAVASTLLLSEIRFKDEQIPITTTTTTTTENNNDDSNNNNGNGNTNIDDEDNNPLIQIWNFEPEKGNVIFCSAFDCWGFSINRFALYWAKKLSLNKNILQKHLFDDYGYNPTTKKIIKIDPYSPQIKPMFVTMILEPLWQMYDVIFNQQNAEKAAKMAKRALGVEIPQRDIAKSTGDIRNTLRSIMSKWIPLADAVLRMVVRWVPNPINAQKQKINTLFSISMNINNHISNSNNNNNSNESYDNEREEMIRTKLLTIKENVSNCEHNNLISNNNESKNETQSEICVFIAKMIPVRISELNPIDAAHAMAQLNNQQQQQQQDGAINDLSPHEQEVFLALGRVFSGTLNSHSNQSLYLLGYHHDPYSVQLSDLNEFHNNNNNNGNENDNNNNGNENLIQKKELTYKPILNPSQLGTYMCLGPSIQSVDNVPAGNIVAIYGLDQYVLKSGTLASTPYCYPMTAITFQAKPMLQVAIEPTHHANLKNIEIGLQKLYQYDPVVEVGIDDAGQNTLTCLGELHLELCLKALKERFAKCDFVVSEPLVSFRETVINIEQPTNFNISTKINSLPPPWKDINGLQNVTTQGRAKLVMGNNKLAITFRCFQLPKSLTTIFDNEKTNNLLLLLSKYLEKRDHFQLNSTINWNEFEIEEKVIEYWNEIIQSITEQENIVRELNNSIDSSLKYLETLSTINGEMKGFDLFYRLLAFGPNGCGSNMLLLSPDCIIDIMKDLVNNYNNNNNSGNNNSNIQEEQISQIPVEILFNIIRNQNIELFNQIFSRIKSGICSGFQITTNSGPLMAEPLYGVGYVIEKIEISQYSCDMNILSNIPEYQSFLLSTANSTTTNSITTTSLENNELIDQTLNDKININSNSNINSNNNVISMGQLISDVKDTLKICLLSHNIRLVEPVYKCTIQCDQSQLGNLYNVLSKRRGEVIEEDIIEGTTFFILIVILPVIESFGFTQELLKKTSGSATAPQLFFSHWSIINDDPFWKAITVEELEDLGETINEINLPRQMIDKVRKRKGLVIEEKIVIHAEKQRTLTRNK